MMYGKAMKISLLKITFSFLLIFAFSASPPFFAEEAVSVNAEVEEFDFANGLFSRGMYDMAIKGYEEFLKRYPESQYAETAVFRIAECYFLSKKYDKAISDYRTFKTSFPSSDSGYTADLRVAQIFLAQKKYEEAENILTRLIGIHPSPEITAASEYYLGLVYLENGRAEQAKKIFQGIVKKKAAPRYLTFAYVNLGDIFLDEGDDDAAAAAFSSAVEYAEEKALRERIALKAGEVHSNQGKAENAKKFYRMIIDDPVDPAVFDNAVIGYLSALNSDKEFTILIREAESFLSRVNSDNIKAQLLFIIGNRYFNSDDYPAAKKAYSEAARLYPDTEFGLMARLNECWTLYRLEKYKLCLDGLESYLEKSGQRKDEAMYLKARVYADMADLDKALVTYNELGKKYPDSEFKKEATHQKAWIYEQNGEKGNAVETYLVFVQNYPEDKRSPLMLLKSAQVNHQLKKYDEAVELYDLFLEKYSSSSFREKALYQLGNVYLEKGEMDKGISIFENFLDEFKNSEAKNYVLFSLGRAYQNRGQWDEAIEKYNMVTADKKASEEDLYYNSLESIAFCNFKKGNNNSAAEEYLSLILEAKDVDVPEGVFLWVADHYLSIGDNEKSLSVLDALKEKYPELSDPGDVEYLFAQNYMAQDKTDKAICSFEQAIAAEAKSPYLERSFLGLGKAYYKKGEYDKALTYLEQALDKHKDDKTSALVRFEIGNVYFEKKAFEEAAKQYMMVAILYDEKNLCSAALFQAGLSFMEAGKEDDSAEAFRELIQRYPDTQHAAKAKSYLR